MLRHQYLKHSRGEAWFCTRLRCIPKMGFVDGEAHRDDFQATSKAYDVCSYCGITCPRRDRHGHFTAVHRTTRCDWPAGMFFRAEHFRQHLIISHAAVPNPLINRLIDRAYRKAPGVIPLGAESAHSNHYPTVVSNNDSVPDVATLPENDFQSGFEPIPSVYFPNQSYVARELDSSRRPTSSDGVIPRIWDPPSVPKSSLPTVADNRIDLDLNQGFLETHDIVQSHGIHTTGLQGYHLDKELAMRIRAIARWCRPKPRKNHSRLEWRCCCGQQFWGDFGSEEPEKLHRLASELQQHGFVVKTTTGTVMASSAAPTTSMTIATTGITTTSQHVNASTSTGKNYNPGAKSDRTSPAVKQNIGSTAASYLSVGKPVYLELCINRSSRVTQLGEIIIVDGMGQRLITTDLELFGKCCPLTVSTHAPT